MSERRHAFPRAKNERYATLSFTFGFMARDSKEYTETDYASSADECVRTILDTFALH